MAVPGWLILQTIALATPPTASSWQVVNDSVMGGVSAATVIDADEGAVVFSGTLSLENNGGFSSIRTADLPDNLEDSQAISLRVVGDGRTYLMTARSTAPGQRGIYHRQSFTTVNNEPMDIVLPLSDFRPFFRGSLVPQSPPLAALRDQVGTIGFMLADKQPGTFELEIVSISTVPREPRETTALTPRTAQDVLATAIQLGVPLYNQGQPQRCADIYQTAILSTLMLTPQSFSAPQQERLQDALQSAMTLSDPSARAWELRRAMDSVLMSL